MLPRFSRILIVDDHVITRKIIRKMLAEIGLENVDEAPDGQAAIHLLEELTYALIISDWNMVPMDGLAFLRHVRNSPRWNRTPFIMATALSAVKFACVARDAGATQFLTKPFTTKILAERIRDVTSATV